MIPLGPVVARSRTKASRASVWTHLTDPVLRSQWWPSLELEPGMGGAVRSVGIVDAGADAAAVAGTGTGADAGAGANAGSESTASPASPVHQARELVGVVDVWVNGHALGFTWNVPGEERGSAVLITLRSQGHHTGVTVTETGFDALPGGAVRADAAGRDWNRFVEALAAASFDEAAAGIDEAANAGAGAAVGGGAGVGGGDAAAGSAGAGVVAVEASNAQGSADLEHSPLAIEGELAPESEATPIEVDAEPSVGDHLELVTGPIALAQVGAGSVTGGGADGSVDGGVDGAADGAGEASGASAGDAGLGGASTGTANQADASESDASENDASENDANQGNAQAALFHAARRQEVMDREAMDREFDESDEVERNPNIVPLVLPGPPISTSGENEAAAAGRAQSAVEDPQIEDNAGDEKAQVDARVDARDHDDEDDPDEPDFDSLLRGLL